MEEQTNLISRFKLTPLVLRSLTAHSTFSVSSATVMVRLKITALGSSFAAGPGIKPIIDTTARRSGVNYAHQLAEALNATLTDLTSSGATTENITSAPQRVFPSTLPAQIDGLSQDADIVTITAGGNDLGYSVGMLLDTVLARFPLLKYIFGIPESTPKITSNELTRRCRTVIAQIKARAPRARVFVVEYLTVFDSNTRSDLDTSLSKARVEHYREQSTVIAKSWKEAAANFDDVDIIPMSLSSQGHGLGSREPWVTGFGFWDMLLRGVVPYHPNRAGHVAMAEALIRHITQQQPKLGKTVILH